MVLDFGVYTYQSGEWGRYGGLPVLKSGADVLLEMGIKSIRVGGSFAGNSAWYLRDDLADLFCDWCPEPVLAKTNLGF